MITSKKYWGASMTDTFIVTINLIPIGQHNRPYGKHLSMELGRFMVSKLINENDSSIFY